MNLDQIVQFFTDVNHRVADTIYDSLFWGVAELVNLAPRFALGVMSSLAVLALVIYRRKQRYAEIDGEYWDELPYEARASYRHARRVEADWLATPEGAEVERRTRP